MCISYELLTNLSVRNTHRFKLTFGLYLKLRLFVSLIILSQTTVTI